MNTCIHIHTGNVAKKMRAIDEAAESTEHEALAEKLDMLQLRSQGQRNSYERDDIANELDELKGEIPGLNEALTELMDICVVKVSAGT